MIVHARPGATGLEGHLQLRGVSFKYGGPESPDILKNITSTWRQGAWWRSSVAAVAAKRRSLN